MQGTPLLSYGEHELLFPSRATPTSTVCADCGFIWSGALHNSSLGSNATFSQSLIFPERAGHNLICDLRCDSLCLSVFKRRLQKTQVHYECSYTKSEDTDISEKCSIFKERGLRRKNAINSDSASRCCASETTTASSDTMGSYAVRNVVRHVLNKQVLLARLGDRDPFILIGIDNIALCWS